MEELPGDFNAEDFSLIGGEGWEDCLNVPVEPIMSMTGSARADPSFRGAATPAPKSATKSGGKATQSSEGKARRITVWNRQTKRKVSGNAAPMEKNLAEYLKKHPECEMYDGQDKHLTMEEKAQLIAEQNRIPIWNKAEGRKISGNAAPSEKNLTDYLAKHPNCEVYTGQDKVPGGWTKPGSTPSSGASEMPSASSNVPIPANVSMGAGGFFENADPFADMYKNTDNDAGVFSMSGLADSLPLDDGTFMGMAMSGPEDAMSKSINTYFAAARNSFDDQRFMGTQPHSKSPDSLDHAAMSPAQKIKLEMASRDMKLGGSLGDTLGMSFSLQDEDLMLMDEETLANGMANDL